MEENPHTQAVKEITDNFLANFIITKSLYPLESGFPTPDAVNKINATAIEIYDLREQEILERDANLDIREIDYLEMAHDAFTEYMKLAWKK